MGRVRHPNLQNVNGKYAAGATVTAITNRDTEAAAEAYTTEEGGTTVTYPVTAGTEGELDIWVPVGAYESTFGSDLIDTPAVWEAISGEELADMLTIDDVPGFPNNVFSPLDFGGDPTGSTDSTAAIQAALDAADAVDGVVNLGQGTATWLYSSQLLMGTGTRLTSDSSGGRGGLGKAELRFTGTGTGSAFKCASVQRCEIDHVEFSYNNTGYTGPLVYLAGEVADIINCHVHHCIFTKRTGIASLTATCGLRLHKVILTEISECAFDGFADNGLQLGTPVVGSSYINNVAVKQCDFRDTANHDRGQIAIFSGDVEALTIEGCSFEGAGGNAIQPIRCANASDGDDRTNLVYSMTVRDCWTGDSAAPGENGFIAGLNGQADNGPIIIQGNFVDSRGLPMVTSGDSGATFILIGNHNVDGYLVGSGGMAGGFRALVMWNHSPTGTYDTSVESSPETAIINRGNVRTNGRIGITHDSDFEDAVVIAQDDVPLVLGGTTPNAAGIMAVPQATIYTRDTTAGDHLTLQAKNTDNANEVQLASGTTPTARVRASGIGVAFNGTAPIAKPTGVGVDAASIHAALVSLGLISA